MTTKLKLSLAPQTFIWSVVNPKDPKKFIKYSDEPGYQEFGLMLTQKDPGPVDLVYEDLPPWARRQVKTAINSGQILNDGDKIGKPAEPVQTDKTPESETTTSRKRGSSKKSASTEKQSA